MLCTTSATRDLPRHEAQSTSRIGIGVAIAAIALLASCTGGGSGDRGGSPPSSGYNSGLTLSTYTDLDASGSPGGPFDPPGSFTLSNQGTQALNWTSSGSEAWIQISGSAGLLQVGESITLTASASGSGATSLGIGVYAGTITFRDTADPSADIIRPATLTIEDSVTSGLAVTPTSSFYANGEEGGPFTPDTRVYTVTNVDTATIDWDVTFSDTFAEAQGASAGTLAPGESVDVTLQHSAIATSLVPGIYSATATFTNTSAGQTAAVRAVTLAISSTVEGWTTFTPSPDTLMVYVSDSGSDSNDGLSPSTPKRTILGGYDLLRDGYPDWLMLERGSTWSTRTNFRKSGRSTTEKMLFRDYGDPGQPRPRINNADLAISLGAGPRHLGIVSLQITNPIREGIDGTLVDDILIEDVLISNAGLGGIVLAREGADGPRNVQIRRTLIRDCDRSGILTSGAQNMLIEECIFYNNGAADDIREHNIYMSGGDPTSSFSGHDIKPSGNIVRGCILLQAIGNYGIKWRVQDNGLIERNVFARNRNTIEIHVKHPEEVSLNNTFRQNVVLEGGNTITSSGVRGLDMRGVQGVVVDDNIWANNPESLGNPVMTLGIAASASNPANSGEYFPSPEDITISNNIVYGWNGPYFAMQAQPYGTNDYRNVQITNNDFQLPAPDLSQPKELVSFRVQGRFGANGAIFSGNRYHSTYVADSWFDELGQGLTYSQWVSMSGETGSSDQPLSYTDPDRDLGTYAATLGIGSSYNSYVNALMLMERTTWNENLMAEAVINYVRAGFDKPPLN